MEYLYHGSTVSGIKVLEPHKRFTPAAKIEYAAIYASSLPLIAAAHAFPWTSDEGIDFTINDGTVVLSVPMILKDRLNQPISIYKVSADKFRLTTEEETGYTWDTEESIEVLEEILYSSVNQAFRKLGGTITLI